jgi:hypothetical protein
LRRAGGSPTAQSFDLNCRTGLSSQRPKDQALCGSVFDEEKPILRRLAQTVHHSSADFGYVEESTEGTSRKGICRSYDRGYPQGEFKKAKGRLGFVGGAVRGNWIEEPVEMS